MAGTVDGYMAGLSGWQAQAAAELRRHLLAAGGLSEVFKWAEPVYESGGPVCWFKAHKAHLTFGFWRGAALRPLDPRIETSGEKMGHIKLTAPGQITAGEVRTLVQAGARLNAEFGNPARGA
jgi:hypothetical protein